MAESKEQEEIDRDQEIRTGVSTRHSAELPKGGLVCRRRTTSVTVARSVCWSRVSDDLVIKCDER